MMRRFWIGCIVAVVFLAAVAILAAIMRNVNPRQARSISGTIETRASQAIHTKNETKCVGIEANKDLAPGAVVTVTDQNGKVIGTSELSDGLPTREAGPCTFAFIADVSRAKTYTVNVANRPGITHSEASLKDSNWYLTLEAGP